MQSELPSDIFSQKKKKIKTLVYMLFHLNYGEI